MGRPGSPKPRVTGAARHPLLAVGVAKVLDAGPSGGWRGRSTSCGHGRRVTRVPGLLRVVCIDDGVEHVVGQPGGTTVEVHGPAWALVAVFTGADHLGAALIEGRVQAVADFGVMSTFIGVLTRFMLGEEGARSMLADGTEMVRLEATTLDGPLVGKYLSREKFERCLPEGVCMADFVLAMDLAGTPTARAGGATGAGRRLGDMYLRPDLSTGVTDPDWPDTMSFLGSFTDLDGDAVAGVSPVAAASPDRPPRRRRVRGALRLRGRVLRRRGIDRRGPPTRDQRAHPARRIPPQDALPHPAVA